MLDSWLQCLQKLRFAQKPVGSFPPELLAYDLQLPTFLNVRIPTFSAGLHHSYYMRLIWRADTVALCLQFCQFTSKNQDLYTQTMEYSHV